MLKGVLTYGSCIEGVEFPNLEISSADPDVSLVEVASNGQGNITINVHVQNQASLEDVAALGLKEATRVVNVIAIEQGRFVQDPFFRSHSLKDDSEDVENVGTVFQLHGEAKCLKTLGGESLDNFKKALSDSQPPGEAEYQTFRISLNTEDVASKFLSLYRMLSHFVNPSSEKMKKEQEQIDKLIKKHEPQVDESISPMTNKPETIYTKLRNEHMHHRIGVPLGRVRVDMERYLPGLMDVVQKAIKNP